MPATQIAFCLAEDRLDCETGLRMAILSLAKLEKQILKDIAEGPF